MTVMQARWISALHEAAHCVVARAVNSWDCTASASIRDDGRGGMAMFPHGLTAPAEMLALAAGLYAEALPFNPPTRRRRPTLPPAGTIPGMRARAVRAVRADAATTEHRAAMDGGSDAERIGHYVVSLYPDAPSEWVKSVAAIHADARRLVYELRDAIRAAAVTLFHKGRVEIPGDPEHEEFFSQPHDGVDE